MALSIKDAETDRLVRRYAGLRKISYTRAIKLAVSDALAREEAAPAETRVREQDEARRAAREIQRRVAALPVLDPRPADEILYDKDGLPR